MGHPYPRKLEPIVVGFYNDLCDPIVCPMDLGGQTTGWVVLRSFRTMSGSTRAGRHPQTPHVSGSNGKAKVT